MAANFQLSDSTDDEDVDPRKPKRTGNVTRVFDPEHNAFKRLRTKKRAIVKPGIKLKGDKMVAGKGKSKSLKIANASKAKPIVLSPLDPEEEREMRLKIKNELAEKYKFIDDMKDEWEETGYESFKKYGSNEGIHQLSQKESLSPVAEPPEIDMTPISRFDRRSSDKMSTKRKRSIVSDSTGCKDDDTRKSPKVLRLSTTTDEESFFPETPENAIGNKPYKRFAKNKVNQLSRTPKSGGTPKYQSSKNFSTPNRNTKNNYKRTPNPKIQKNEKSPHFKNRFSSSPKWKKFNSSEGNNKNDVRNSLKDRFSQTSRSSLDNRTPEFMKVKHEDSVKQERKDRKRMRNIVMSKKTKRGQPVMKGRIEMMLEQIKADLNVPL